MMISFEHHAEKDKRISGLWIVINGSVIRQQRVCRRTKQPSQTCWKSPVIDDFPIFSHMFLHVPICSHIFAYKNLKFIDIYRGFSHCHLPRGYIRWHRKPQIDGSGGVELPITFGGPFCGESLPHLWWPMCGENPWIPGITYYILYYV